MIVLVQPNEDTREPEAKYVVGFVDGIKSCCNIVEPWGVTITENNSWAIRQGLYPSLNSWSLDSGILSLSTSLATTRSLNYIEAFLSTQICAINSAQIDISIPTATANVHNVSVDTSVAYMQLTGRAAGPPLAFDTAYVSFARNPMSPLWSGETFLGTGDHVILLEDVFSDQDVIDNGVLWSVEITVSSSRDITSGIDPDPDLLNASLTCDYINIHNINP